MNFIRPVLVEHINNGKLQAYPIEGEQSIYSEYILGGALAQRMWSEIMGEQMAAEIEAELLKRRVEAEMSKIRPVFGGSFECSWRNQRRRRWDRECSIH